MSDSIWSRTMSKMSTTTSESSEAITSSKNGMSSGDHNTELVRAEEVNEVLKRSTRSIIRTLNFSSTTQQQFTEVNLNVASSINERFNEIVQLGTRIDEAINAIPNTVKLPDNIAERLLARIKVLFEMVETKHASLRKLVSETNAYLALSNVGEMCETVEETHRRLLLLQKHMMTGFDLSLSPIKSGSTDVASNE